MSSHFCYLSNVQCGYMRVSGSRSSRPSFHAPQVAYVLTHLVLRYPWFCFVSTVGCFFFLHKKMILISPTTTTLPSENPTRWSSAGPATNNSRTFGTTSRFHHLKPVADGTPQKNGCVHDHVGVELMDEYLILFDRSVYLGWWYTRWFQSKWEKYSRLQGYSCCRIVHLPKWR